VVVVVNLAVVEVDDDVDGVLLHPTTATESAASVAAAANRRFTMISSCHQVHGLGRAKGPEHRWRYPRGVGVDRLQTSQPPFPIPRASPIVRGLCWFDRVIYPSEAFVLWLRTVLRATVDLQPGH